MTGEKGARGMVEATFERPTGCRIALSLILVALSAAILASASACGSPVDSSKADALLEYRRGLDLQELDNLDRAFEAFSAAIELDPKLAPAYAERGRIYHLFGNPGLAMANLNRAIELDRDIALAYYYRGLVLADGVDSDQALLNLTKAIQLDPEMADAYLQRSRIAFQDDDFEAAIDDLSAAITLEPESPWLYLTRGQVYIYVEDTARAIADLERVLVLTQNETLVASAKQLLALVGQ